jgi:hypothetical protein
VELERLEGARFVDISVQFTRSVADEMHSAIVQATKTRKPA